MHFVHTSFRILMYTLFAPYTPYTQYATKVLFVNILIKIYLCVKIKKCQWWLFLYWIVTFCLWPFFKTLMVFWHLADQLKTNSASQHFMSKTWFSIHVKTSISNIPNATYTRRIYGIITRTSNCLVEYIFCLSHVR